MRSWREKLDALMQFNERDFLQDAGKVTKTVSGCLALEQYDIFHQQHLRDEASQSALNEDA